MMGWKMNCIFSLVIIPLINRSFAAIFIPFESRNPEQDYKHSRSTSVYPGILLSYSLDKKIKICRDIFSEHFDEHTVISDGLENAGEPQHALTVRNISYMMFLARVYMFVQDKEDLFFKCSGKNSKQESIDEIEYFVSTTFHRGFMYGSFAFEEFLSKETSESVHETESDSVPYEDIFQNAPRNVNGLILRTYIGMSPEFDDSLDQIQLEEQYVARSRKIRTLRIESPLYVKMIEDRDNISELSLWQKFLLCSSIILSPKLELERHKFTLNWFDFKKNGEKKMYEYRSKCFTFSNGSYKEDNWCADSFYCQSSAKAIEDPVHSTNLLLTRSYDDKNSLYVLIEELGAVFFKLYVKNAPILINMHVPFTDDEKQIHSGEYNIASQDV